MRFDGDDVTGLRADRLTRRGLNFVPQTDNVFPTLTVAENLHVGALVLPSGQRDAEIERVRELFPILAERARQRAGTLSGGQRKLVALARALVARPRCCCSTSRPRGSRRSRWTSSSTSSSRSTALGIGIVMVEQNARRALALATRATCSTPGRNATRGPWPAEATLDDPRVGRALPRRRSGTGAASTRDSRRGEVGGGLLEAAALPDNVPTRHSPLKVIVFSVSILPAPSTSRSRTRPSRCRPFASKSTGLKAPS